MKVNWKDDIPYMENNKCLKPPTSSKSFDSWCIMVGLIMGSPSSAVACYGRVFHLSRSGGNQIHAMVVEKIHGKTDTLWLFNMAMENGP